MGHRLRCDASVRKRYENVVITHKNTAAIGSDGHLPTGRDAFKRRMEFIFSKAIDSAVGCEPNIALPILQ